MNFIPISQTTPTFGVHRRSVVSPNPNPKPAPDSYVVMLPSEDKMLGFLQRLGQWIQENNLGKDASILDHSSVSILLKATPQTIERLRADFKSDNIAVAETQEYIPADKG